MIFHKFSALIVPFIFLLILLFCMGCTNYYEFPKTSNSQQSSQQNQPNYQQTPIYQVTTNYQTSYPSSSQGCPPPISNCKVVRGVANQLTIQCDDGRLYVRGTAGQITIQYPGKQISIGSAGQETIQGFESSNAQCLIQWLKNY